MTGLAIVSMPRAARRAPARFLPTVFSAAALGMLALAAAPGARAAEAPSTLARVRVGSCLLEAPPGAEAVLFALGRRAPAILAQVEADLGCRAAAPYRMVLIPPGRAADTEIATLEVSAPPWAAGFYIPGRRTGAIRLALAARYPYGTVESVLAHEAAHALLHDAVGERLPRWFEEGVATREGRRWSLEDVMVHSTALVTADFPSLDRLEDDFHASDREAGRAYAASFAFVSWAVRQHGEAFVRDLLREARAAPFERAWRTVSGAPLPAAEARWRKETVLRYRWLPIVTASSTLWLGMALLGLAAGARRRARARAARERMPDEEELEEVAPPEQGPSP